MEIPNMPFARDQAARPKLSICITTLNRADFIGATLDSILSQAGEDFEVVVLDGGSTDDTERIVTEIASRFESLRYFRQDINNGIDRDYDRAVELARGEYCWLMTDDDFLKPGSLMKVLQALQQDVSLLVVNAEAKDLTMSKVVARRLIDITGDRVYEADAMDRLFVDVGEIFQYIGIVVIKRAIWMAREKERYYGSLYVYLGVIFQERLPGRMILIAEPLISYRLGNTHTFSSRVFEILMVHWPSFIWSLPISSAAKGRVCHAEPWRSFHQLLLFRGWGIYSMAEFRLMLQPRVRLIRDELTCRVVARLPGVLANSLLIIYYSVTRRHFRGVWCADLVLHLLRSSRFHISKLTSQ